MWATIPRPVGYACASHARSRWERPLTSSFTHLHLHSQYSLLDGAIRLKDLFGRLQEYNMNAVALTDHGNMFGAVEFFKACKGKGVKPIVGTELNVVPSFPEDRNTRGKSFHLTLLARSLDGYKNLMRLKTGSFACVS